MREKSITIRLPKDEYTAFNTVCNEKGYSKTGKIRDKPQKGVNQGELSRHDIIVDKGALNG